MQTINLSRDELHDHVIIVGAGRMGRAVAAVLQRLSLPFVAIELDQHRLEFCREAGVGMIFGDATHPLVLEAAGLAEARLLLITMPDPVSNLSVLDLVHRERPDLHVVVRAETEELMRDLQRHGSHEVVMPQLEAGLEVTRQALLHLDLPLEEIRRILDESRTSFYGGPGDHTGKASAEAPDR